MNSLLNGMRQATNNTKTENGALSHASTLSDVLDLFYHAAARRGQDNTQLFATAYGEDRLMTVLTAFYIRDVRGGQGERESFKQFLRYVKVTDLRVFERIVALVPVYGRWDDVLEFVDNSIVVAMVREQIRNDVRSDNPSLLAKWMPSENASSKETKKLALKWAIALQLTVRNYRQMLSELRKKIGIVERDMSAGNFNKINFAHVPSRAAMLYRKAFVKQQPERYAAYMSAVEKGEATINSGTLYPYELVEKYLTDYVAVLDRTVEAQWKALPNYADTDDNALVVADVSGSMKGTPMNIAISLALYISERNRGAFKDYFLTFSSTPALQRVTGVTLFDRVRQLKEADWGMSTNLQATFDLILSTALANRVPQSDMPTKLFIVSDMQFNSATGNFTNFEAVQSKYARAGYEMPTIIFWNVSSRNNETPVTKDANGVYLVSGASPSIYQSAIKAKAVTPTELMIEVLTSERYAPVMEALR